ncbi:uncharacterized protein [Amphiura filiformis]|uniref:uncharacterized protein isoform X1 n=1 Tax=Amphiura filiformis TaxID=82378 RepID=UPI003B215409
MGFLPGGGHTNNMETLYREQNGTYMFRAAMALLEMQVGDIILEINGEPVHGKTTKEVVTSLMRSPDDLILKVKEDTETRASDQVSRTS